MAYRCERCFGQHGDNLGLKYVFQFADRECYVIRKYNPYNPRKCANNTVRVLE